MISSGGVTNGNAERGGDIREKPAQARLEDHAYAGGHLRLRVREHKRKRLFICGSLDLLNVCQRGGSPDGSAPAVCLTQVGVCLTQVLSR